MDSLRYWVTEMHVDGFRFDLASSLAREFHEVDRLAAFFDLVNQDPMVSQVKLIAEPWDVGEGGYQVGGFPPLWTEWNGKYRDTVRDFWRGEPASLGEFASRFTGSSDLYEADNRRPIASINFVTAHDGFTLDDLVSYNHKHNEANGEDNQRRREPQPVVEPRRRRPDRRPRGRGAAGAAEAQPPDHAAAVPGRADDRARRRARPHPAGQQQRLLPGQRAVLDRLGRRTRQRRAHRCSPRSLTALRAAHPVFRRQRFFQGRPIRGSSIDDIAWLRPDGQHMTDRRLDVGPRPERGGLPQRAGHPRPRRPR